ncbi:MAG: SAM-dependent methyltransferase [Chitinophagales bacterium]|nr:SAM-dependent methyltransferase [Chitinophagales bacterium]
MQNSLYLIPTTLGENWANIPQEVKDLASNLDVFIVENLRSARRHLRKLGNQKDFDSEVLFFELDKHQSNFEGLFNFINEQKQAGKSIGLLSEAGNPCIADPGANAVELAHQLGLVVKPLVGPSSILMALISSGFNGQQFTFNGYLPIEDKEKRIALKKLESLVYQSPFTQIFMETPYRNEKLVDEMISILRPETKLCIAVELGEENEFIETRQIKNWKKRPNLHKRPAVFVLGK